MNGCIYASVQTVREEIVVSSVTDLIPETANVTRGFGPNTRRLVSIQEHRSAVTKALEHLHRSSGQYSPYQPISTSILRTEKGIWLSRVTTSHGFVSESDGGAFGRKSAAGAGAITVVMTLPASANDSPASRGAFVSEALQISVREGGLPILLRAPRGQIGSLLAVEAMKEADGSYIGKVEELSIR